MIKSLLTSEYVFLSRWQTLWRDAFPEFVTCALLLMPPFCCQCQRSYLCQCQSHPLTCLATRRGHMKYSSTEHRPHDAVCRRGDVWHTRGTFIPQNKYKSFPRFRNYPPKPASIFPRLFLDPLWYKPPSSSSSSALMWADAVLMYLLIPCTNPLNQIYVVVDVTSVHPAKRHQSALRLAQREEALSSRVTENYCRNDHLRLFSSGSKYINTLDTIMDLCVPFSSYTSENRNHQCRCDVN